MHRKQAWAKRVKKERFKKKYVSRMQATRMLQVDSIQFRRLCILKGIYPRALTRSKQKQSGNDKQYYLSKEIKWLVRDHLADRMMAHRAWLKKVRRAEAMGLRENLQTLRSNKVKPHYNLVATIKERYPFFIDAVKDIDDAMSIITLYAFLSPEVVSETTIETHHALTSGLHERAKLMCERWNKYVAGAHALTKGFISIKGYYYEAIVRGERVRWLCPHEYAHKFPSGIQQYIMLSFLEFYLELMRFILLKLERDLARDREEEEKAEDEGINNNAEDFPEQDILHEQNNHNNNNNNNNKNKQKENEVGETKTNNKKEDALSKMSRAELMAEELRRVRSVFNGLTFYISREVPRKHVALIIESCGGRVANLYLPDRITHCVIDRPSLPSDFERFDSVEYIQPQYLFDCLNARFILPANGYRIAEDLPPHVSPFTVSHTMRPEDIYSVEEARRDHPRVVSYVPRRTHEIRKLADPTYNPEDPKKEHLSEKDGKYKNDKYDEYDDDDDDENEEERHAALLREIDGDDDVSLSGDEIIAALKKPSWEEEEVMERPQRSKLSALKVKKQREMNLMNAPTSEAVARRRKAQMQLREARQKNESPEKRMKRKIAAAKREEAATRKMQLQVARKKAARYYKMVNGVVQAGQKREKMLEAKAKQIAEGRISAKADGSGLQNTRVENKRQRLEARGIKPKEKKADNPYKKLPKWVR